MIGMRRHYGLAEAIGALYPNARWMVRDNDYQQLEWYETDIAQPLLTDIEQKIQELEAQEPVRVMREIRDWYLAQSDWTQGVDLQQLKGAEWCAAWATYRQQLRDLPDSDQVPYFDEHSMIAGIVWPTKPTGV